MANSNAAKESRSSGLPESAKAFLTLSDIDVVLTYGFAPEPIVFPCMLLMNDDEKAMRQKFYAQPAAAQESGLYAYLLDMLCSLLRARPRGLPGFDELINGEPGDLKLIEIRDLVRLYFAEQTPIAKKILADAVDRYTTLTQPTEFFR